MSYLKLVLIFAMINFLRYFFIAGSAYAFFWLRKSNYTEKYRIQSQNFKTADMIREFIYSCLSCFMFGAVFALAFKNEYNLTSIQWSQLFQLKSVLIYFGLIIIHDTYFYWMHRLIHFGFLYKTIHHVHHLSRNPSPWTALSFSPTEAFLEIIWVWPIQYFFHIDLAVWIVFAFTIITINVMGHLGVEVYPTSWKQHHLLKFLNFSKDHNDHHKYFKGNYGLYFSIWDRVCNTYRPTMNEKLVEH